jgi:2-oxo-4-hydroxy-4-carboxy-5-ureidoimidazoline decarboxylase
MLTNPWLIDFNAATGGERTQFERQLSACCAASSWIAAMVAGRPYAGVDALFAASDTATAALDEDGLAQALAAHPRIGERRPAAEPAEPAEPGAGGAGGAGGAASGDGAAGADESAWSRQEQAGVAAATDSVRAQIAEANAAYERRFGQVYLVCATGKTAEELLEICRARHNNDIETEQSVVREELAKIARIRLAKLWPTEGSAGQ